MFVLLQPNNEEFTDYRCTNIVIDLEPLRRKWACINDFIGTQIDPDEGL